MSCAFSNKHTLKQVVAQAAEFKESDTVIYIQIRAYAATLIDAPPVFHPTYDMFKTWVKRTLPIIHDMPKTCADPDLWKAAVEYSIDKERTIAICEQFIEGGKTGNRLDKIERALETDPRFIVLGERIDQLEACKRFKAEDGEK